MKRSIYCLAKNEAQLNHIISDLHALRITDDSISVLYADNKGKIASQEPVRGRLVNRQNFETSRADDLQESSSISFEKGTKSAEGAVSGATAGGLIGGTLGLLAGLGSIALPGVGTLVAAGPIMAALSGVAVGSISGGIAGSLTAAQIPEYYIKQVSKDVEEGRILIAVDTDSKDKAKKVSDIFEKDGATDVSISKVA